MSVAGFFSVYVTIITMLMYELELFNLIAQVLFKVEFTQDEIRMLVQNVFDLSYLAIIFPVLGTGMAITINSWIIAYRRRDLASVGISAYNTGAQIHNLISAVKHVPQASRSLGKGMKLRFKAKDGKAIAGLVLFLFPIVVSLGGAVLTTTLVMRASDARYELDKEALA